MYFLRRNLVALIFLSTSLQALASPPRHDSFLISKPLKSRQNQIVFPPSNGPCRQNHGLSPLECSAKECVDIADQGLCHIQTQEGFPVCGCCEAEQVSCSSCGGDAGGGICKGTGRTGKQFQGCTCNNNGGNEPTEDESKVCQEDNGQDTLTCSDQKCGGSTFVLGLCNNKTPIKGPFYRHCACCPTDKKIGCDACGGDAGGGKCNGVDAYSGFPFRGCKCTPGGGGDIPIPIIPFPIPPPGFPPIIPPGTPRPKKECAEGFFAKCSECEGKEGFCQSGPNAGCLCKNDCSADDNQPTGTDEPKCEDEETCKGQDGKCTIGPSEGCKCKEEDKCPSGKDSLQCSDSTCGGATNSSMVSGCKGGQNGENKDCRCYQSFDGPQPYRPMTQAENAAQQALLDSLADLSGSSGACENGFKNSTTMEFLSTGNIISINYRPDAFPEVFKNPGAQWRLVDTSGFITSWNVTRSPGDTVIGTSENGTVVFSVGATDGVTQISANGPLDPAGKGGCPVDVKISIDAACPNNLPKAPATPTAKPQAPSCTTSSSISATPTVNRPHPADNPSCSANSAKSVDEFDKLADGTRVRPHDIFYMMRETLCNNKCELPANIPPAAGVATVSGNGCEIAIGVSGSKELYVWRETPATGLQQQDCWDSLASITDKCINNGPNTGWVNGPDDFEFFQAGVRNRDDPSKKHPNPINGGLLPTFIVCETCGGNTKNGGTCSSGPDQGNICCPSGLICCNDSRCNADGGSCTGGLNGCGCIFNGGNC